MVEGSLSKCYRFSKHVLTWLFVKDHSYTASFSVGTDNNYYSVLVDNSVSIVFVLPNFVLESDIVATTVKLSDETISLLFLVENNGSFVLTYRSSGSNEVKVSVVSSVFSDNEISFAQSVYEVFDYIEKSVPSAVINVLHSSSSSSSLDYDRSDILVFLTVISYLFGDSRYTIVNWFELYDLDKAVSSDVLSLMSSLVGFDWLDNMSDSQRVALKYYTQILCYKGTLDGIVAMIRYNTDLAGSEVLLSKIFVQEQESSEEIESVKYYFSQLVLDSPYTYSNRSVTDSYRYRKLMDRLEEVRPAGVAFSINVGSYEVLMNYWVSSYYIGSVYKSVPNSDVIKYVLPGYSSGSSYSLVSNTSVGGVVVKSSVYIVDLASSALDYSAVGDVLVTSKADYKDMFNVEYSITSDTNIEDITVDDLSRRNIFGSMEVSINE